MRLQFAHVKSWCTVVLSFGISVQVWAAVQTTPYIAIHTTPQYDKMKSMPYANAQAPKGGQLSYSGNGTFDNLNSMNGKGTDVRCHIAIE